MEYGIVYPLANPVMLGLVKIGMTTQEDIVKRMRELYTTGAIKLYNYEEKTIDYVADADLLLVCQLGADMQRQEQYADW